jgi:exodeoxyribonuclease III
MHTTITSWNVNGIRAAHNKGLFEYLERKQPTIFCIQETKVLPEQLTDALLQPAGFAEAAYHSCRVRKGYSGVATWSRMASVAVARDIGIERFDAEGRVLQTDFDDFVLFNVYFPNSAMLDKGRLEYKLEFYDAFFAYCETLRKQGRKLVICGDFNIAHTALDLARPKANEQTPGFLAVERAKFDEVLSLGYVDTFREFERAGGHYSWWSYRPGVREANIGWRIDYVLITKDLLPHLDSASIHADVLGSDHCPVSVVLKF